MYVDFGDFARVDLIETDVDVADFFLPNGAFKGRSFELLSFISDDRREGDASPYQTPASQLPRSETEGVGTLEITGKAWTNLPAKSPDYVPRPALEEELHRAICDDRHPVVTLVGRGGTGKTSLAVAVLNRIAVEGVFGVIVWFSARDIDLLSDGPKAVSPRVLTQSDIADEFARLMQPSDVSDKSFHAVNYLNSSLMKGAAELPTLFVFDNFETVRNPGDLFALLDTNVRLPNKILITTRHREFKADYPIEVSGMAEGEANQLIDATAQRLQISALLTSAYKTEIREEADGHPYIIKVLLGEVAKARMLVKVERIIAGRDDILEALFERTYAGLSPVSRRVFLTLCSWRSLIPEMALEAVLLRPANEKMDVESAIEELVRSSFVERISASDGIVFLDVALVAFVFGRKKLEVTPMKAAIDADVEFLQQLGATSETALRHGARPAMEKLFGNLATRIANNQLYLEAVVPSLEFLCRRYPYAWFMLAELYEEQLGGVQGFLNSAECLRRFLESPQNVSDQRRAWSELDRIYRRTGDWIGAAQAQIRICKLPNVEFSVLSNTANWLNELLRGNYSAIDSDEKRLLYAELTRLMENRATEANAADLSRLAWLYLHLHEPELALKTAKRGLSINPGDEHCLRLVHRLQPELGDAHRSDGTWRLCG